MKFLGQTNFTSVRLSGNTILPVPLNILMYGRLGNGWFIKMIYPCCVGVIYPYSVAFIDLLHIRACQRVYFVKAVSQRFLSFITFQKKFTDNALAV